MTKKIKLLTCLCIAVIIVGAFTALAVVKGNSIGDVSGVSMAENTASSVKIKWKSVKGAEGYRIYTDAGEDGAWQITRELDGSKTEFEFTEQKPVSVYKVKVTAFKHFNNKVVESEGFDEITVYTMPGKAEQSSRSADEGVLTISWTKQDNVGGYELEYSKNKDFDDSTVQTVESADTEQFEVKELTPNDIYFVRVRLYAQINGETVYGEWSDAAEITIKEKPRMGGDLDPNKSMVAISFDDGPGFSGEKGNPTSEILDVLEEYGARATFFMVAKRISDFNIDCLKRELELGCELGNHTYSHERYGKNVTADDIKKCNETIKQKIGQYPTIFRCTGGMMSKTIREECCKEGMPIAYWSIDTEDWKSKNPDLIYKKVVDNVYDGSIILMHDIYPTTAKAVKRIVPYLIEQGYQVVGVTEMLQAKNGGKAPKAGEQYIDYKTINNNT